MSLRTLKLLTILLPPLIIGGFEYIRHDFLLPYLSMEAGNFYITVLTLILSYLFGVWMFRNIERSNQTLAEEQYKRAVYEERERLAGELHDDLAQTLFFLNVKLKQGQLEEAKEAVADLDIHLRQAIFNLRTDPEDGTALQDRLHRWLHDWQLMTGIELTTDFRIAPDAFTPSEETQLFGIVQEAFTNIRKHSKAKSATIAIHAESAQSAWRMRIADDGVGLQHDSARPQRHGIPLMRKRANRLGADMEIDSPNGLGTQINIQCIRGEQPND